MIRRTLTFPSDFVWGAATASAQIEGAATEDGKGESIWDRFSRAPGKVLNGDTPAVACDHYHRYREDVALMQELNLQAYRFSIAWPRIQPNGSGSANSKGLDFYDRLVDELLSKNIQPWATLYHWDLPQALQDKGGWTNRDTVDRFAEYSQIVVSRLGDRVKNWMTINEPWVITFMGNLTGEMAPGIRDEKTALAVAHGLLLGHGKAMQVIRATCPSAKAGIVLSLSSIEAASDSASDHMIAERLWRKDAQWFLNPLLLGEYPETVWSDYGNNAPEVREGDLALISQPTDFMGINYYFRHVIGTEGLVKDIPGSQYTDMGWEVHAPGFKRVLLRLNRDYANLPPLYITENGAAFADTVTQSGTVEDSERLNYIRDHLHQAYKAMEQGVNLKGYFAWSLLDNFEWHCGYSKRFGLTYVDYQTQRRIIKSSGLWYRQTAKTGQIEVTEEIEEEPAFAATNPALAGALAF